VDREGVGFNQEIFLSFLSLKSVIGKHTGLGSDIAKKLDYLETPRLSDVEEDRESAASM
jgi:hypothetical protein